MEDRHPLRATPRFDALRGPAPRVARDHATYADGAIAGPGGRWPGQQDRLRGNSAATAEYSLTGHAYALKPVFLALLDWSRTFRTEA